MENAKKAAYEFFKCFGISAVNAKTLREIIKQQGYTIVEYNSISNTSEVELLLNALNVKPYAKSCKAFTYADHSNRILFVSEGLSERETLILLAHEEGHIFCGHLQSAINTYGQDILFEQEANEFAHYILKKNFFCSVRISVFNHPVKYLSVVFIVVLFAFLSSVFIPSVPAFFNKQTTGVFVVTRYGAKYHKPDCYMIKNSKTKITVTTEALKEKYPDKTPCSVCMPEKK